ncbi:MAG TPA: hypothetical protein VN613_01935 [Gemmatimonadaceae bacterium]|nr:hypothetical protein [Gemmatimonadaceae bacterium]
MMRALSSFSTGARLATVAAGLVILGAHALGAQQAGSSVAAAGMDNNYVAMGQGKDAANWNPAMLGMSGNPHFSLNIFSPSGSAGLAPVSWNDFAQYAKSNDSIPSAVRHTWLNRVTANGGETGDESASFNWLGLSVGPVALSVSTTQTMSMTFNPDMFQALMFGNAGNTGSLQNLDFTGSKMHVSAFSTAAVSYGYNLGDTKAFWGLPQGKSSVGITLKYVMGNFLLMGQDAGSTVTANNVALNFPIVMTNTNNDSTGASGSGNSNNNSGGANAVTKGGSGIGMDVGYSWRGADDKMTISVVIQNLFNSFKWDVTQLESRQGTAMFNTDSSTSNFNSASYSAAPQSLQQMVKNYVFKPSFLAGVAYKLNRVTTVTGDFHQQFGDDNSILVGPKTQLGAGIEFRGVPFIPLHAGLSYVTGGYSASAGVGIALGPVQLGVAGRIGHSSGGNEDGFMLNVISIR